MTGGGDSAKTGTGMDTMGKAGALGIIAALNKPQAQELEREIALWLGERGIPCRDEATMLREGTESLDALIVLGGDGLMMRTARMFPGIPLLGINFGHVGFLTHSGDVARQVERLCRGEWPSLA